MLARAALLAAACAVAVAGQALTPATCDGATLTLPSGTDITFTPDAVPTLREVFSVRSLAELKRVVGGGLLAHLPRAWAAVQLEGPRGSTLRVRWGSLLHAEDVWVSLFPRRRQLPALAPAVAPGASAQRLVVTVTAPPGEGAVAVRCTQVPVSWKYVGLFAGGMFMFLFAEGLAENALFYYSTGTALGALLSIVLLAYMLYRNRKSPLVAGTVGLSAFTAGAAALFGEGSPSAALLRLLAQENVQLVAGAWLGLSCLLTLALLYYYGPPQAPRTQTLLRLSIRLLGLAVAACGFSTPAGALAGAAVCLLLYTLRMVGLFVWLGLFTVLRLLGCVNAYYEYCTCCLPRHRFRSVAEADALTERVTRESLQALRAEFEANFGKWAGRLSDQALERVTSVLLAGKPMVDPAVFLEESTIDVDENGYLLRTDEIHSDAEMIASMRRQEALHAAEDAAAAAARPYAEGFDTPTSQYSVARYRSMSASRQSVFSSGGRARSGGRGRAGVLPRPRGGADIVPPPPPSFSGSATPEGGADHYGQGLLGLSPQ